MKKLALLLFLAVAALMLPGRASAGEKHDGVKLYRLYCAQCHGLHGDSFGVNSYDMDVAPRDHTDTAEMSARTDAELFKAIKFGGKAVNKSILMPNWDGNLSDEEIHALVKYLRELCCKKGDNK
ncbi:MAG: cytochrome c [Chrysiogenetes bacterium]|nr:cytochrome c [Chrysiogenetes bacterium]